MNKISLKAYIAIAALLIMALQSCKRHGDDIDDYSWMIDTTASAADTIPKADVITVLEKPDEAMWQTGGQSHIKFSTGKPWRIQISQEAQQWLSVIPAQGGEGVSVATITLSPNPTNYERNAAITIISGNASKTVTVAQKQLDAILASSKKVEVMAEGETISLEVKANIQYMHEVERSAEDWIAPDLSKQFSTQIHKFIIKPNPSSKARQGDISFIGNSQTETVTVYQYGKIESVVVSNSHYTIPQEGGDIEVEIRSNSEFSASVPSESWLKLNTEKTQSDFTRVYTASPNKSTQERSCFIEYVSRDRRVRDTVFVTQGMFYEKLAISSDKEFEMENPGGEITISVDANTAFTFEMPEWITGSKSGEEGDSAFTFTIAPHSGYDDRTGTIKVTNASGAISDEVKITQSKTVDGLTIASYPEGKLPQEAGSYLATLKSNARWVAQVQEGARYWITLDPASGEKENMEFLIKTSDNNTYYERTGSISIKSGKIVKTISITQLGIDPVLEVKEGAEGISVPFTGGDVTVTVYCNMEYKVEYPSWVSCNNTNGSSGTNKHVFSIGENESVQELSSRIKFTTLDGRKTISIPVTQSKSSALFYVQNVNKTVLETSGGDALIQFITNSAWTAKVSSSAQSWMFLNPKNGGEAGDRDLVVTASRNDLFEDRQGTVTITAGPITKDFTFTQPAAVPGIQVKDYEDIEADYYGKTITVDITANIEFDIKLPGWISGPAKGEKGTRTYKFTIARNSSYDSRQCDILLQNDEYSVTEKIAVAQSEKVDEIKAFVNGLSFPSKQSFLAFDLNASDSWTANNPADWISLKPASGQAGKTSVEVTVQAHSGIDKRTAEITFTCGKATATVPVTQAATEAYIDIISGGSQKCSYLGGGIAVEVSANTDFSITTPDWVTGPSEGKAGQSTLKFNISRNEAYSSRDGDILIFNTKYNANSKVTINQELKKDIVKILEEPSAIVPAAGGKATIKFNASDSWSIYHQDNATPSPEKGAAGDNTVEIAVEPNTSNYGRTVVVQIICGRTSQKVEISQSRKQSN